jgi:hypothetical protein
MMILTQPLGSYLKNAPPNVEQFVTYLELHRITQHGQSQAKNRIWRFSDGFTHQKHLCSWQREVQHTGPSVFSRTRSRAFARSLQKSVALNSIDVDRSMNDVIWPLHIPLKTMSDIDFNGVWCSQDCQTNADSHVNINMSWLHHLSCWLRQWMMLYMLYDHSTSHWKLCPT